jgi:hypothetical protein
MLDIVAATIIGNAVFLGYVYVLWRGTQLEKQGQGAADLPFWAIVLGLVPAGIVVLALTDWWQPVVLSAVGSQ